MSPEGGSVRDQDKFMLRLPDGMRDRIRRAADENGRSMNAEIVATLEDAYPAPISVVEMIDRTISLVEDLKKNPTAEKLTNLYNALEEAAVAVEALERAREKAAEESDSSQ